MFHGIGGWQNCLFSKCTILPIPSFRNRIPIIVDKVTTLVGPGDLIDVIITERGIAINPKRKDLIKSTKQSGLPIRNIEEIKEEVDANLFLGQSNFHAAGVAISTKVKTYILDPYFNEVRDVTNFAEKLEKKATLKIYKAMELSLIHI